MVIFKLEVSMIDLIRILDAIELNGLLAKSKILSKVYNVYSLFVHWYLCNWVSQCFLTYGFIQIKRRWKVTTFRGCSTSTGTTDEK